MGDAQHNFRIARSLDHLARFASIHCHRLLDKHRLAVTNGLQHIGKMQRVGSGDEHRVHIWRCAQFCRRNERVLDAELLGRLACAFRIAA